MKKLLFFVAMFCSIAMTAKAATETCDCGSLVKITATPKEGYHFVQWSDGNTDSTRVVEVNENLKKYVATFAPNLYEISFKNWNGQLLLIPEKLPYGSAITYNGSVPTKPKTASHTYTFKEWNPTLNSVPTVPAHDQSFTAVFDSILNEYTIYYKNYDGTILQSKKFGYGTVPAYENLNPPTKPASKSHTYTFKCWSPTEVAVTDDATYVAQFDSTEILYDITFKDWNGTELATIQVPYDEKPEYPGTMPTRTQDHQNVYTFSGWTPEITSVTGNATYTAVYSTTPRKYQITFKDYDGRPISKDSVAYGTMPTIPQDPTRTPTDEFTYTFAGWDEEVVTVTGDKVYTATYDATKNKYTITLTGAGGEYIGAGTYEYGTEVTIIAKPEGCKDFVKWSDGDTNATRKITVTGDATYIAEFEHITYTITVESADETMGTVTIEKL